MEDLLKNLNPEQLKAVKHKTGPLLILAGAGTGKTTVVTRKIAYIISQKWAKPSEILALTFTDKAAAEMEERVDRIVPYGFVDTQISTFHAFGDRLLRDFALDLGLPANFKVLTQTEQAIFVRENLYAFDLKYFRPIANPISHISELLKHFSRLKDELIAPEDYLQFAQVKSKKLKVKSKEEDEENEKQLELAKAYSTYQDLMIQSGNLDFGDQIYLTYKLLKENEKVLNECREKFKFILVDEFQDTNFAQYQIIKLLAQNNSNVTVVGDDDQSIYKFRGASISNILSFKDDYPKCKQIVLNKNYRSTQQILDASYKLIKHNNPERLEIKNKINKKLFSNHSGDIPELLYCETLSCEADEVAKKIVELKKLKGYRNNDFVILARANNHLIPFIQSLNLQKIPNVFVGSSSLFEKPEIKMLVAFLKCLVYDDDNLSFYELARSEIYNIDENVLAKYYTLAKRENQNFFDLFQRAGESDTKILEIIEDIKNYRSKINSLRAGEVLYDYLKHKKYFKNVELDSSTEAELKIINIAKLFDRIAQFDHTAQNKSVLSFLENLELILSVGDEVQSSDIDPDLDAVNLMSVHASKGLEWPVVFIVNMVSDRFPSRDRREKLQIPEKLIKEKLPEGDFHLQEERRLFYVGATRAKQYLFLTSAGDYGGKRLKKVSQFVLELLDESDVLKLKAKLSPFELSRQQIDDYHTCPKKYYFASKLQIPLPTNWHFMYGTAIHESIGRYYQRKMKGESPTLDLMIKDFNQSFTSEGFITRQHEEERKRTGIETLTRFFVDDQKLNLMPHKIEERFEFIVDRVRITGRYDLIMKSGDNFEICDFKTSEVKDQKDADRRIKDSIQMKIYALSWFANKGKIPKTSLYFIESDLKGTKEFSNDEIDEARKVVEDAICGIKRGDFQAMPNERQCGLCPYKDICRESAK
ncbi:MAG: ATP-dependent DNA helicase [Candidatus Berkelbacteria bacterium]|nr:ATP-dependent DNA helicase [Candidatus Berkelbacteria bacterium]